MSTMFAQVELRIIPNWQRSPKEQRLYEDLLWIKQNVSNSRLAELFDRLARALCRGWMTSR
jgi:hypothetical protein